MYIKWKKIIIGSLDVLLAVYLVLAVTSWNKPNERETVCNEVNINISDTNNAGFLSATEVKDILTKAKLYPLNKAMQGVSPRRIEETLKTGPFIKTAQCYKNTAGQVVINITQRMPIIRIKSDTGDDYYLDDNGGILPNSKYTSDLIIATGNINKHFAQYYLTSLAKVINASPFWLNQIEQIHVLPDKGIELVPRVGNQIIFLGYLPYGKYKSARERSIRVFVSKKLERLHKFYKYGLSQVGWNLYNYIDLEFDNQIVCKKNVEDEAKTTVQTSDPNATTSQQQKEEVFEKKPSEIKKEKRADVPMAEEGPTV